MQVDSVLIRARALTQILGYAIEVYKQECTGVLMGDSVIVINAKDIKVNPTRVKEKIYYRHSGYPGGLKAVSFPDQLENHPDRVIKSAVWGMLPHNKHGRHMLKRLKIYSGQEHPHAGQKPEVVVIK